MVANNEKAVEISSQEFDEIINNPKNPIVIADFFAEWCMPCVMMAPIFEEMAEKFKKIKFVKVNVDENSELSGKMNVASIPTILIFKKGKEIDRIVGGMHAEALEEKISRYK